jgi:hypothetical protein
VPDGLDAAPITEECSANLYLWDPFTTSPSSSGWTVASGAWGWDGADEYSSTSNGSGPTTWLPGNLWTDFVYEVEIQPLGTAGDVGVIFRATSTGPSNDSGEHYYVGLYAGLDEVVLGSMNNGWTLLTGMNTTVTTQTWYTLRIHAVGSDISVFLDDSLVLTYTDNTWASGSVGFRTYRNEANYGSALVCD